ncbi:MAG: hypothetical protein ACR2NZ_12185 [Rubripirellula sp.]
MRRFSASLFACLILGILPCDRVSRSFLLDASAGTRTWDDRYDTENIEVTVVYFVPADRQALVDWRERVDYYCKRIEQFHAREFQGQSTMRTIVHPEPLVSKLKTDQLRKGDANAIYYRTLEESDRRLQFAKEKGDAFPILLVLSEINWRPLDDFYRVHRVEGDLEFEGNVNRGQHFPGAKSGGARASYRPDRGVGWGLVSADGWRVPYRGSDCVIYHEGCGHTVGLPHPDPGNGSVMSLAQYRGWISESWLDKDQKSRMKWIPREVNEDLQLELFSKFRAIPSPMVPKPGEAARLKLDWPQDAEVARLRVRFQTAVGGPWIEVPQEWQGSVPSFAEVGTFDRATPVSYRVDVTLDGGQTAELWGYFQVREDPRQIPIPRSLSADLIMPTESESIAVDSIPEEEIDLLALIDTDDDGTPGEWMKGKWTKAKSVLESPKAFGARLELPYAPPEEYRMTLVVEPLDDPNGLLVGNVSGTSRFVTLFNHQTPDGPKSAIENIDGRNVGNESTFNGSVLKKNRISQIIVTIRKSQVTMTIDGRTIVAWQGDRGRLSLSDYWKTPEEKALFLGAYDCRYRFHRVTLEPLSGTGTLLEKSPALR